MQFKYPELLWALLLLLIPVIIHLFQLRRFKKTPFTNVKLLQKVVAKSRKSNTLKKWLLLFTRLLLLTSFIIAFAQPYFAAKSALVATETIVYIDDSFSMQAKNDRGTLLEATIQDLIKSASKQQRLSIFTNEKVLKNVMLANVQNDLISLATTPKQLQLPEIYLKANTLFNNEDNTVKKLLVLSDFQERILGDTKDSIKDVEVHMVQLKPASVDNVSIDSVFVSASSPFSIELTALLQKSGSIENIAVSLLNGDTLIAKTGAVFDSQTNSAQVVFTLPSNEIVNGKIQILDSGLSYDNQLYFNIDKKEKINVLSVGSADVNFLERIYTSEDYNFSGFSLKNLNYSLLDSQNLIILNELDLIPTALINALSSFTTNGGSLLIIPSEKADIASYNSLYSKHLPIRFRQLQKQTQNIVNIEFSHPLYSDVFEKTITNFQYPSVNSYYKTSGRSPVVLSLQNKDPFLMGANGLYTFTAALSSINSNFKNSPLIVPTLYNIGYQSLKLSPLYFTLGQKLQLDIPVKLQKDRILNVVKNEYDFIPLQQSFTNKVAIEFGEDPTTDGIFSIMEDEKILKYVSFNYPRGESKLSYLNLENIKSTSQLNSVPLLFETIQNENSVKELWKWFIILALLFILIEVLIQKILK